MIDKAVLFGLQNDGIRIQSSDGYLTHTLCVDDSERPGPAGRQVEEVVFEYCFAEYDITSPVSLE